MSVLLTANARFRTAVDHYKYRVNSGSTKLLGKVVKKYAKY